MSIDNTYDSLGGRYTGDFSSWKHELGPGGRHRYKAIARAVLQRHGEALQYVRASALRGVRLRDYTDYFDLAHTAIQQTPKAFQYVPRELRKQRRDYCALLAAHKARWGHDPSAWRPREQPPRAKPPRAKPPARAAVAAPLPANTQVQVYVPPIFSPSSWPPLC